MFLRNLHRLKLNHFLTIIFFVRQHFVRYNIILFMLHIYILLLHNILNVCKLYKDYPESLIFYFVHYPLATCTVQITLEDLLRKKNLVKSLLRCAIFSAECSNCIFVIPLTPACQRPAVDKRGRKVQ